MAASCAAVCFGIFLTISSVLYIGEMLINGMFVYALYFTEEVRTWFVPYIGLLLLPMVTVQLVSAVLLLMKKADKLSSSSSVFIAVLHIFQIGFLWRHFSLFRETDPVSRSRDLADLHLLQTLHTFTSMLPLLFIQCFFIIHHNMSDWLTLTTACVTLFGSCWCLASFRRHHHESEAVVLTWPGTVFRFTWRCGEVVSRIISLTVFTSLYYYWIFLILGLHGMTMLVCLCTSVLGMFEKPEVSRSYKVVMGLFVAYMYSFCFINLSSSSTTFRYTFFYIVMFLENVVLTLVWYLQSDHRIEEGNTEHLIMFISGSAFFVGIISMILYYKCFHINASKDFEREHICETDGCINCRLSVCSKHNIKLQRPFSAGWLSQYQQALVNGHYYKNIMQDNMIDSELDSVHDGLNSSGEHWQIRDTDLESVKTCEKKQFTSMQASGTYAHKRFFDSDPNIAKLVETDSISSGSGIYDEDWRQKPDTLMTQMSMHDSLSVLSSRTELLTDSWDNLVKQNESVSKDPKHPKRMDVLNSLIRNDLDTSFFSDGYNTDHTLDSYQLPITVLAKKRSRKRLPGESVEKAYSIASDSTDCTICAFMRQNPSSPEESRRNVRIHERIPEESQTEKRKTKHVVSTDVRNKRRKTKSTDPSKRQSSYYAKVEKRKHRASEDIIKVAINGINVSTSPNIEYTQVHRTHRSHNVSSNKTVEPSLLLDIGKHKASKVSVIGKKSSVTDHRACGKARARKISLTDASDSGDSAFPRNTPLSSYLAATDDDQDGRSESSCEMII